jgi:TolB-like protein
MSPEQVRGRPADQRSDLFSCGAILYEMLAGRTPFERDTPVETGYAILNEQPAELPANVPPDLASIVRRCLEKKPQDRFQSARELALQLQQFSSGATGGITRNKRRTVFLPLLAELNRRRVFRALVGYGIGAFAVLQIIEPVMHGLHWPDEVLSYVVVALAVGFPVVVSLAWIFDVNAGRIERTAPAPAGALKGIRLGLLLVGIGALAAAPGTIWYFAVRAKPASPSAARTEAVTPSIAVLPFADMSPQKDQEYFSDGLAEEILNALAQVEGLRVTGRTSSFSFKGKTEDLRTIGQKLGVGAVLEGSVRKSGDRVRVTAQMVDVTDGFHLWSQTYDRELKDIFAVQDEIAASVVAALRVKLTGGKAPTAGERRTADPEAYSQYLLGRRYVDRGSPESERLGVEAFRRALALDPTYAPAWAALAWAIFIVEVGSGPAPTRAESGRRALEAAEKALQLAPRLADAWATRGALRFWLMTLDWDGVQGDLARALALAPGDAEILRQSALLHATLGRPQEATAEAQRATELDPLASQAWWTLGNVELRSGRLDLAERALKKSLDISSEQSRAARDLGFIYLLQGRPQAALDACERSTLEIWRLVCRALAWRDLGRATDAARALKTIRDENIPGSEYQAAQIYGWQGDLDGAFSWLGRALEGHDPGLNYVKNDPLLSKLRGDPRYTALLKKLNLPVE